MTLKLEGSKRPYHPKNTDEVCCEVHGIRTTRGQLTPIQQLAVEEGIDTVPELECLLAMNLLNP